MNIRIRAESASNAAAIDAVTRAAFAGEAHSSHTEHLIVAALRAAAALELSLVASAGDEVVGHIAFSSVSIADGTRGWFGLAPLSVLPRMQGRGIGRALVEQGLAQLHSRGAAGCVVLGDPALYGRFGFRNIPGLLLPGVPPEYFLAIAGDGRLPQGEVRFHEAFDVSA